MRHVYRWAFSRTYTSVMRLPFVSVSLSGMASGLLSCMQCGNYRINFQFYDLPGGPNPQADFSCFFIIARKITARNIAQWIKAYTKTTKPQ